MLRMFPAHWTFLIKPLIKQLFFNVILQKNVMESNEKNSLSLLLREVLPEWSEKENFLNRDFKFNDFTSAFSFMSEVALVCEEMDHHPNWENT